MEGGRDECIKTKPNHCLFKNVALDSNYSLAFRHRHLDISGCIDILVGIKYLDPDLEFTFNIDVCTSEGKRNHKKEKNNVFFYNDNFIWIRVGGIKSNWKNSTLSYYHETVLTISEGQKLGIREDVRGRSLIIIHHNQSILSQIWNSNNFDLFSNFPLQLLLLIKQISLR